MTRKIEAMTMGHRRLGDGPAKIVVLHDWHGDHTTFAPTLRYLDQARFAYAFADLPGYGLSRDVEIETADIDELASGVLALADRLGWQCFHLVGHSLSAMIAQRVGVRAPDRVSSITAICPLTAAGSSAPDDALAVFAATIRNDDAFRRLMRFMSGPLGEGWVEAKLEASRRGSSGAAKEAYFGLFRMNFAAALQGAATPVLVILGDRDPGLDEPSLAPLFRQWYRDVTLVTLPNCGHYPMEEAPPQFVTVLERFLARHG